MVFEDGVSIFPHPQSSEQRPPFSFFVSSAKDLSPTTDNEIFILMNEFLESPLIQRMCELSQLSPFQVEIPDIQAEVQDRIKEFISMQQFGENERQTTETLVLFLGTLASTQTPQRREGDPSSALYEHVRQGLKNPTDLQFLRELGEKVPKYLDVHLGVASAVYDILNSSFAKFVDLRAGYGVDVTDGRNPFNNRFGFCNALINRAVNHMQILAPFEELQEYVDDDFLFLEQRLPRMTMVERRRAYQKIETFIDQGLDMIRKENFSGTIQHLTNNEAARSLGYGTNSFGRRVVEIKPACTDAELVQALRFIAEHSGNYDGILKFCNVEFDHPDAIPQEKKELVLQHTALVDAEEWIHSLQHIRRGLVAKISLPSYDQNTEADVALYLFERGIPLTEAFVNNPLYPMRRIMLAHAGYQK